MIAVSDVSHKLGEYQRPYLTVFRISETPDATTHRNSSSSAEAERIRILYDLISWTERDIANTENRLNQAQQDLDMINIGIGFGSIHPQSPPALQGETYADVRRRLDPIIAEARRSIDNDRSELQRFQSELKELQDKLNNSSELLTTRYPPFNDVIRNIDIYSLKTVMPDRKSQMNEFWWEGELFYYPGRDTSQKSAEFTFILDQDMLLLPFLYAMKDLTGTTTGQYRAPRGNVVGEEGLPGYYSQEFKFEIYQIATDRQVVTGYVELDGVRIYEVGGIIVDKSHTGETVQTVTVKCGWDYTNWDDSKIGMIWGTAPS